MVLRALVSFAGAVSMCPGEEREIQDPAIARDLLKAGYAEEVRFEKAPVKAEHKAKATAKKKSK